MSVLSTSRFSSMAMKNVILFIPTALIYAIIIFSIMSFPEKVS